jgi:hypothetical protein
MREPRLDISGSEQGQGEGFSEHINEYSGSVKYTKLLDYILREFSAPWRMLVLCTPMALLAWYTACSVKTYEAN